MVLLRACAVVASASVLAACAAQEAPTSATSATGAGPQAGSVTATAPAPQPAPSELPTTAPAPTAAPTTTSATSATPAPTASPTAADDAGPAGGRDRWVGTWTSGSCGSRKYPRVITLAAGGSFTAEDRISPCPKNVACVWSGIVNWKGTWAPSGDAITLSETGSAAGPKGEPHPTRLDWKGAPAEGGCVYAR